MLFADKLGPERFEASVPWQGRMGRLVVVPQVFSHTQIVSIDGNEVARLEIAGALARWSDVVIRGSDPVLKVVQILSRPNVYKTMVFVDDQSLEDHRTWAEWRAQVPPPMDGFEARFSGSRLIGPRGALIAGIAVGGAAIPGLVGSGDPVIALIGLVAFAVVAGWIMLGRLWIVALLHLRRWPDGLRGAIVILWLGVVPLLLLFVASSLLSKS
jgi:hypothetical protein